MSILKNRWLTTTLKNWTCDGCHKTFKAGIRCRYITYRLQYYHHRRLCKECDLAAIQWRITHNKMFPWGKLEFKEEWYALQQHCIDFDLITIKELHKVLRTSVANICNNNGKLPRYIQQIVHEAKQMSGYLEQFYMPVTLHVLEVQKITELLENLYKYTSRQKAKTCEAIWSEFSTALEGHEASFRRVNNG